MPESYKNTQLFIDFNAFQKEPDPRSFACPTEVAHYAVDNSGMQHKAIAAEIPMSTSLLTQKLHGNTANLYADEYERIGMVLGAKGELLWKYFAAKLLPKPGRREQIMAGLKELKRKEQLLLEELERA